MKYEDLYQFFLVLCAFLVIAGVGIFVYYELFPQYKIYQQAYIDLENFRSNYTHEKPAPFSKGVKQILIPDPEQGPEIVDRCISCHVAVDLPHFSPTRVALDVNDRPVYDAKGNPVLEPNPDYIWARLDEEVALLRHPEVIQALRETRQGGVANRRLSKAELLNNLKKVKVEGKEVDMTKVLQMHPLIGSETSPFEFHPMSEYGCTSCHSGNGQALVAKRAHGPVYDGEYEKAFASPKPKFTEEDLENDPPFARMYNDQPGHALIFQTTPILTGPLIVAKCVQCHQATNTEVKAAIKKFDLFTDRKKQQLDKIQEGLENDQEALVSLDLLEQKLLQGGREGTLSWLNEKLGDPALSSAEIDAYEGQLRFLQENEEPFVAIEAEKARIVAADPEKRKALSEGEEVLRKFQRTERPLKNLAQDSELLEKMQTSVDRLIGSYKRGKELFVSQACYACHRIAGFSRSSVGPELTNAGYNYPWFIKESIVWPQADLPSSTMPNFRLDHEELADLMTFLMAQKGDTKAVSEVDYQISIKEWEQGAKMPWEKPVPPTAIDDVRQGVLVFATEGCAACHQLEGVQSNFGFSKDPIEGRAWFEELISEEITGSELVRVVEEHGEEIDTRIVEGIRDDGIVEEIEAKNPGLVAGFYANFKFASRAKNTEYVDAPEKLAAYLERLNKVLMLYIEIYGLGREIAPHLSFSGVYRDPAWLLGHFHNPAAYTAKSIMPVMPFDNTKFYMLNNMLQVYGKQNRDQLQELWRVEGFNPPLAYDILCAACHGEQRQGNGIISEWIYPIPKNLRNPVFLRNLTKERAIDSITHGVPGTPMPPWGEAASLKDPLPVLTRNEIIQLVDWLYQGLPPQPRQELTEDYEKWSYAPTDVIEEMENERDLLPPSPKGSLTTEELVDDYFKKVPNPVPGPDKNLYYIREKYYTPENLAEGEQFYLVNCAACHGREGTGTGLRATTMVEAKPRMLTNLPWVRTRDDLRLIRSIKFGVPGTAMTPWGDQTTSTQRMQLVMFIRELTRSQILSDALEDVLYDVFDQEVEEIEKLRAKEYANLEEAQRKLKTTEEALFEKAQSTETSPEELGKVFAEQVKLEKEVEKWEAVDAKYREWISLIKEERKIMAALGNQVIAAKVSEEGAKNFFHFVENGKDPALLEPLFGFFDQKIASYQEKIALEEAKIRSPERGKAIQKLMEEQRVFINLKTKFNVQLADAKTLREKQKTLEKELQHAPTSP